MADYWGRGEGLVKVMREKLDADDKQIELVEKFMDLYDTEGLLSKGRGALPLCKACDQRTICWAHGVRQPAPGDEAGVSLPWIGCDYPKSRLCVLGLNGNKYGTLGATWWITKSDIAARRGASSLGGQPTRKQRFYLGAGRCLALTDPNLRTQAIGNQECAQLWERVAFMEAVKCGQWDTSRGSPTPTMVGTCPSRYLRSELEILRPKSVLVVGKQAWGSVAGALGAGSIDARSPAARSKARIGRREVDLYFVVHPAARGDSFVESVAELERLTASLWA